MIEFNLKAKQDLPLAELLGDYYHTVCEIQLCGVAAVADDTPEQVYMLSVGNSLDAAHNLLGYLLDEHGFSEPPDDHGLSGVFVATKEGLTVMISFYEKAWNQLKLWNSLCLLGCNGQSQTLQQKADVVNQLWKVILLGWVVVKENGQLVLKHPKHKQATMPEPEEDWLDNP